MTQFVKEPNPDGSLGLSEISEESMLIGEALEKAPPWGMQDRYSADGWAHIAHAVLRAKERIA